MKIRAECGNCTGDMIEGTYVRQVEVDCRANDIEDGCLDLMTAFMGRSSALHRFCNVVLDGGSDLPAEPSLQLLCALLERFNIPVERDAIALACCCHPNPDSVTPEAVELAKRIIYDNGVRKEMQAKYGWFHPGVKVKKSPVGTEREV